jgi:hypothetical protein
VTHERHELVGEARHAAADADATYIGASAEAAHPSALAHGEDKNSLAIAAVVVVALGLVAFLTMLPGVRCYMKIRSMSRVAS